MDCPQIRKTLRPRPAVAHNAMQCQQQPTIQPNPLPENSPAPAAARRLNAACPAAAGATPSLIVCRFRPRPRRIACARPACASWPPRKASRRVTHNAAALRSTHAKTIFRKHSMILEIAQIDVKPGMEAEFKNGVQMAAPLFKRAKGCLGMSLWHSHEMPERFRLFVQWQTLENHIVDFREFGRLPGLAQTGRPLLRDAAACRARQGSGEGILGGRARPATPSTPPSASRSRCQETRHWPARVRRRASDP